MDADLELLIYMMSEELGRHPTEQEVYDFIFGDEGIRHQILRGSKR